MRAYIIYNRFEADRNRWFADRFISIAKEYDTELILLYEEELIPCFKESAPVFTYEGRTLERPAFVINRTQNHIIAAHFERAGVRVFNSSRVCRICNNKMLTFELASSLGLPFMDTEYHANARDNISLPAVLKPLDGKGGADVIPVYSRKELLRALPRFEGRAFLSQKIAGTPGRDMRLYALGGKIIAAFLRYSENGDLRSNFGIHGNAKLISSPGAFALEAAEKIISALSPDFVGIDFIFDGDRIVFNEVEDCVGSRMIYANTDIDIAREYFVHITDELCRERQK